MIGAVVTHRVDHPWTISWQTSGHNGEPSGMATTSFLQSDSQTGVAEPTTTQESQQPQITAVTNGGVSIVPNSIADGPLVHMGTYTIPGPSLSTLTH